jgi:hypothetical protein
MQRTASQCNASVHETTAAATTTAAAVAGHLSRLTLFVLRMLLLLLPSLLPALPLSRPLSLLLVDQLLLLPHQ